jgi:GLPGLI family protein
MKHFLTAFAVALLFTSSSFAQKFEGVITYAISFENSGLPPEALAMLKGAESKTYIKDDKRRVDMTTPMQSSSSLIDNKTKSIVTTMEIMGQKYMIRTSEADLKKEKENAPQTTIKYLDDTKEIAGYKCKKAEVTTKTKEGKEDTFIVYYTDEIPASDVKSTYEGLKGVPLEYSIVQGGIRMSFTAKSVSKEKLPDSKFELDKEGYQETTLEELQRSMGK